MLGAMLRVVAVSCLCWSVAGLFPRSQRVRTSKHGVPGNLFNYEENVQWLNLFANTDDVHGAGAGSGKSDKLGDGAITPTSPSSSASPSSSSAPASASSSWGPTVLGAWRSALDEAGTGAAVYNTPPSLRSYLCASAELPVAHKENVQELWDSIRKRGSLRDYNEADQVLVREALTVAYVGLYGKTSERSHEACIERARGTAAVLGELRADVTVVVAGILHDVFPLVFGDGGDGDGDGDGDGGGQQEERDEAEAKAEATTTTATPAEQGVPMQAKWLIEPAHRDSAKAGDMSGTGHLNDLLHDKVGEGVMALGRAYAKLPHFLSRRAVYTQMQSENHIQMVVASAADYRALYMRLAERLHTMRVLRSLPLDEASRQKIAQEALHVYAPLAHKMGVGKIKGELQDLAFRVLEPEGFQATRYTQIAANKAFHDAAEAVQEMVSSDIRLKENDATYRLTYRIKDKYELWRKAQDKHLRHPSEVRDALGLRIIVNHKRFPGESDERHAHRGRMLTYYITGLLRKLPGWDAAADKTSFKDYIKHRKENGYESLHQYLTHTGLGTSVEVQVRTREMHVTAELGGAAHWYYKDQQYRPQAAASRAYRIAWRSPQQVSGSCRSPAEMIGYAKQQLTRQRVFVFLEDQSTVLNLRKGSTSLDAAFAIHSELGLRAETVTLVRSSSGSGSSDGSGCGCEGAGAAGAGVFGADSDSGSFRSSRCEKVGLDTPLQNGDIISVRQSETGELRAKHSWCSMVKTPSAISALRKHFRETARGSTVALGLMRLLLGLQLNKAVPDVRRQLRTVKRKTLSEASRRAGCKSFAEFLFLLGTSSRVEGRNLLARLMGVDTSLLTKCPPSFACSWATMQQETGWRTPLGDCDSLELNTNAKANTKANAKANAKAMAKATDDAVNRAESADKDEEQLRQLLELALAELQDTPGLEDIQRAWHNSLTTVVSPYLELEGPAHGGNKNSKKKAAAVFAARAAAAPNNFMARNAGRFKKLGKSHGPAPPSVHTSDLRLMQGLEDLLERENHTEDTSPVPGLLGADTDLIAS